MGIQAAIIADDLTGALDTGTPFVDAGLAVVVATDVEDIPAALRGGPDVLVVNTGSRALPPEEASARVSLAAAAIMPAEPSFIFKKIDSRLKGNIAIESEALARSFGYRKLLVAPAIPDQQRFTRGGSVVGRGIHDPIPILPLFAGPGTDLVIADAETEQDLDRILANHDWNQTVAVGARGLGLALARRLRKPNTGSEAFHPSEATLFAVGSRDPITEAQMVMLKESGLIRTAVDAPAGALPDGNNMALPALISCTGEFVEDGATVANRFAASIEAVIGATAPDIVIAVGGDTAHALLRTLKTGVLVPKGEIEAGIPWFEILLEHGREIRVAMKSGGFGTRESLIKAVRKAA